MDNAKIKTANLICKIMTVIVVLFMLCATGLNLFYNYSFFEDTFKLTSFLNQHIYQEQNAQELSLPDAYIRELIRDKSVVIPCHSKDYDVYSKVVGEDQADKFSQAYYRMNNYARYFENYSKLCRIDETIVQPDRVRRFAGEAINTDDFENLGLTNDMLRYSFLLNTDKQRESAYFWYSWFYYSFATQANDSENYISYAYVMKDECEEAEELVAIWDYKNDLYIMPYDVYEEKYRSVFDDAGME